MSAISRDRLEELLCYDAATGCFIWRVARGNRAAGSPAGTINTDGHRQIRLDGKTYYTHRLIWFWETGTWPLSEVDHRDRNRLNNRFGNLRDATSEQNRFNQSGRPRENGLPHGVYAAKSGRFRACITFKSRARHIGVFDTVESALAARIVKEQELFGEYARQR